jgi:DNA polymerase I-like protein with 3'-5' exonuclease and polymerase domains
MGVPIKYNLVIDFETYYDSEYSLRSMMGAEYIHDSRFQVIGFSFKLDDNEPVWVAGDDANIAGFLRSFDWSNTRVIAHNALFDGAILEWKFGHKPKEYFCTMMGSRPHVVPYTGSMSLESVARYLGIGEKGSEVQNHKGRRRESFTPEQLNAYGEYCKQDVRLSFGIAEHLSGILPDDEKELIDLTIKKFTRPVLLLDDTAIKDRLEYLQARKALVLEGVKKHGMTLTSMRSRTQFVNKLKSLGVTAPEKISVSTGKITNALSKKDPDFLELLAHPDEAVRTLVYAKLELGSNLEESRLARFQRLYNAVPGHKLPVPLLYYGAHPGRFSGLDGLNLQNLPRPKATDPERAALRRSIVAPEGYQIIAADFSNIEARIVATLAQQWDLVDAFKRGDDVYSQFASKIYRKPIDKKANPIERFVGKTCILGLGYGMGAMKLQLTLATSDPPVSLTKKAAWDAVMLYRETYPRMKMLWDYMDRALRDYSLSPTGLHVFGPITFTRERIILPNGMPIIYSGLRADLAGGGMTYGDRHLWGGAITENVVQALARIIATRAELRLARAGLPAVHQAHDELIFCVREEHVDVCEKVIARIMTDPVPWLPKLPVSVEIHHGPTYGDCK